MRSEERFRVTYDAASDVLYLHVRAGIPAISSEGEPGVFWRYSGDGDIVGVTVIDFETYWGPRIDQLIDDVAQRLRLPRRAVREGLTHVH